jgi:hypothetical protein
LAEAHRQTSAALRAKTKQPEAELRLQNYHFKNQQSSLDNHQSVAGKNAGIVPGFFAKSVPNSPQRREVRQVEEQGRKLLVWINLFWKIQAQASLICPTYLGWKLEAAPSIGRYTPAEKCRPLG